MQAQGQIIETPAHVTVRTKAAPLSSGSGKFTGGRTPASSTASTYPEIVSFSQWSAIAGGAGFTLTVNGAGFTTTSIVLWNGAVRDTTYVSSTQLKASILESDISHEGTNFVSVGNLAPAFTTAAQPFAVEPSIPVPSIASAAVSNAPSGNGNHSLTVVGAGFVQSSTVALSGSVLNSSYVNPWTLAATITQAQYSMLVTTGASITIQNSSYETSFVFDGLLRLPIANAGGPYSGYMEVPMTFNGGGSSDPQGEALTYSWNFGDNTTGSGVAPAHTYTACLNINCALPETFTVTLTVTDLAGLSSQAVTTATVAFPPPEITINGPYTGKAGLAISFTSTVTNPLDADWTYEWNFGDGEYSNVPDPTHVYTATGTYNVSLYVTGQYNESATVTSTATIVPQGAGPELSGIVESGNVPVTGAHVYLYAANTTGYAQASAPLLSDTGYSDANGSYVLSDGNGNFTMPGGFSCTTHSQVYLYATGGTVGSNSNSSTGLLSALGACGSLGSNSFFTVNEVTTVAAAYALSGYATSPTQVSSPNTAAALTGIGNAFLNAANLASSATGKALAVTPAGNGTAPQTTVNTLASILNGCVSATATSSACTTLFANAESGGNTGTSPADTAGAAINIAQNQGASVAALYALLPGIPAFTPVLTTVPHDWTMGISYFKDVGRGTVGLAVDGGGNVWVLAYPALNGIDPYLTEFSSNGAVLQSENTTCSAGGESLPDGIAVDPEGNVWLLTTSGETYTDSYGDEYSYSVSQYCTVSSSGVMMSPPGGYSLGGSVTNSLSLYNLAIDGQGNGWFPSTTLLEYALGGGAENSGGYILGNAPGGLGVAIDGSGDFWVTSPSTNGIVELNSAGRLISPANGFIGGGLYLPGPIALDNSGNVWAINTLLGDVYAGTSLSKLSSSGVPLSGSGITNSAMTYPYALATDGAGNVWVANGYNQGQTEYNSVVELAPSGALKMYIAHPNSALGYLDEPESIAVDSSGSVWVSDGDVITVTQFVGVATPVVTPIAANLAAPYNAPASRP